MNIIKHTYSFDVFSFRSVDEPILCKEYIEGHQKVLKDFGIENITSNVDWTKNPQMYCVIAIEKQTSKMLAGIRIQVADGLTPLPVELAIGKIDGKIYQKVEEFRNNGGVGELCGLWVDNAIRKIGLSVFMIRAAIAASIQLKFKTMVGICSPYSFKMFQNVGFIIDYSLGQMGNFNYPNENYIANVVGILDTISLKTAVNEDKQVMEYLRNNRIVVYTITTENSESTLNVNLNFYHNE